MNDSFHYEFVVPPEYAGLRLDKALAKKLPEHSRARLQQWLASHQISIDGECRQAKTKVHGGETIIIHAILEPHIDLKPQAIQLEIVYEDEHLLVINKPPNFVVHPAAGHHDGTLLNGLLHHCPELEHIPRAGLIHRLDKDTSGLLVIAKTLETHTYLVDVLQKRDIHRDYFAIVQGPLISGGVIRASIGRHPNQRIKMAVTPNGKPAVTHYRINEKLTHHTALDISLETGRTHQIRVHMAHIHHPIVGDPLYGGRPKLPRDCTEKLKNELQTFPRQALHARRLKFIHPYTRKELAVHAEIPDDINKLLNILRESDATDH